jgi:hypothetical protein
MFAVIFFAMAVLAASIHSIVGVTSILETFLFYFLVIDVGAAGVFSFTGHFFRSDEVAGYIGWPAGNPFRKEIAFTNLTLGTLGFMCICLRGHFWTATVVAASVFLFGAAAVHMLEIRKTCNMNPGNAGPILFSDILKPLVLIGLLIGTQV